MKIQRHRKMPCEDGDTNWSELYTRQGMQKIDRKHQKLERVKERVFPTDFRGRLPADIWIFLLLDIFTSGVQL